MTRTMICAAVLVLVSPQVLADPPADPPVRCAYGDYCQPFAKFQYLSDDPDVAYWSRANLQRIQDATCVPLAIAEGQHTIEVKQDLPGTRVGQTVGGTWDATHVEIVKQTSGSATCATLLHELLHVLGRTNGHSTSGVSASPKTSNWITGPDLDLVCQSLPCRCMRPER